MPPAITAGNLLPRNGEERCHQVPLTQHIYTSICSSRTHPHCPSSILIMLSTAHFFDPATSVQRVPWQKELEAVIMPWGEKSV